MERKVGQEGKMKGEADMADLRLCDSEYSEVCGGFPGEPEDI